MSWLTSRLTLAIPITIGLISSSVLHSYYSETWPSSSDSKSVSYRGVTFSYDPSLATEIKGKVLPAIVLENADDKPDGIMPEHIAFTLVGSYASGHKSSFFAPEIHIYPIEAYKRALIISEKYVQQLEGDVEKLKSLLSEEPTAVNQAIPFLPFGIDATQSFRAHVKFVEFKDGKGVLFVTQYDIEPSLVNNSGLVYVFQGISNDGVYYISATFPITAPSLNLPKEYETGTYEDYKLPTVFGKDDEKNYSEYRAKMVRKLEELPPDKFEPGLNKFEELIRSLCVSSGKA